MPGANLKLATFEKYDLENSEIEYVPGEVIAVSTSSLLDYDWQSAGIFLKKSFIIMK